MIIRPLLTKYVKLELRIVIKDAAQARAASPMKDDAGAISGGGRRRRESRDPRYNFSLLDTACRCRADKSVEIKPKFF